MNEDLRQYLQLVVKYELKWMYHYDVNDDAFGIETDKYTWCKRAIVGDVTVQGLLEYFSRHYSDSEEHFIEKVKTLSK